VSELEARLQTKLFNRSSRALVPTDAGRSYIDAAKRILADAAEAAARRQLGRKDPT
jgi:DNA-binding transcriptional LysR family regulator